MGKKEKKLLAGIVLLLFLAIVIIGYLLVSKKRSSAGISDLIAESLAETDFDFLTVISQKCKPLPMLQSPFLTSSHHRTLPKRKW